MKNQSTTGVVSDETKNQPLRLGAVSSGSSRKCRKIPLVISYFNDNGAKGYRAEIPDNYESWKPTELNFDKVNFEDIGFHFHLPRDFETHENDDLVFVRRRDAANAARHVNKEVLNGRGKLYFF